MPASPPRSTLSYVVAAPQASDAVGGALRNVYDRRPLPAEMTDLLLRLDEIVSSDRRH